jgi:hypothetical protein
MEEEKVVDELISEAEEKKKEFDKKKAEIDQEITVLKKVKKKLEKTQE